MKVLNKAKNDFENIEYFTFEVTNREIADLLKVTVSNHTFDF